MVKLISVLMLLGAFLTCDPLSAQDQCFAYIALHDGNAISVYSVDGSTGALTPASITPMGFMSASIAIDPSHRFAFVANGAGISGVPGIAVFTIDPNTGSLGQTSGSFFPTGLPPGPNVMVVHPSGKFLYAANAQPRAGYILAYSIDVGTGALTPIPGSPYSAGPLFPRAVTIDPTGKFLFAADGDNANVLAFTIDANTGALSTVPGSPFPLFIDTFVDVVDPTGRFLYTSAGFRYVAGYSIDSNSGVLQPIAGSPFPAGDGTTGVAIDPSGCFVFAANQDTENISGYAVDSIMGALSQVPGSPFPAGNRHCRLTVDPTGKFLYGDNYGSNNISVYNTNIEGPVGIGANRYVSGSQQFAYLISFENSPTSSAPAHNVFISDPLPESFDIASVSVAGIPLMNNPYTGISDLRPKRDLLLKIDVALDTSTRVLSWTLQSLDPATNQPTTDPLAGYPAPGDGGVVRFTAMAKAGLATGTVIQNQATIVFDVNTPVNTPTWSNTLDNTLPISHVLSLPSSESSANFNVSWTGSDIGSGINDFTIYVSDNGGPYAIWLQNTAASSAAFTGQSGHTYAFYSIARDLVGNLEVSKSVSEATTLVDADTPNHPADTSNDWRLSIDEITAYGAAWKRGDYWQTGPNPIPIDYVTNSGALWKTGELYRYDSTKNRPLCWIGAGSGGGPLSSKAASPRSATARNDDSRTGSVVANAMMATRVGQRAGTIEILITPGAEGQVYAVEETVPAGWNVLAINEGGEYDRERRNVRWGPFLDNASRKLTYTALPTGNSGANGIFTGVVSFDGKSIPIRHNTNVSDLGVKISQ
jgi:uncharacterized repeat protein (TIGR01451 family)